MAPVEVRKAAVVGAGLMGSAIAAQFANGGVPVVLLDVPASGAARNALGEAGVQRQLKIGGFMHPGQAKLVTTGNLEDDMGLLADADWIVEAIVEDAAIKRDLFQRIDAVRKPGSVVSSNTSTIRLSQLMEGLSPQLKADFVITHFCNPPRPLRLLEVVAGPETTAATLARVHHAADLSLGKTVLDCRDTPGFVANRIGCYWMSAATLEAVDAGLTVEEADAVMGAPFGIPGTGIFRLWDMCGIDLIPPIWGSLYSALPPSDPLHAYDLPSQPTIRKMIENGWIGAKAKGGFYRATNVDGARRVEALDLVSASYRPSVPVALSALTAHGRHLRALCEQEDKYGQYAWRVLSQVVSYAATVVDELVDRIEGVDVAMRLGYGWKEGPFQLADRAGPGWIADRLAGEGRPIPERLARAAASGGFHEAEARNDAQSRPAGGAKPRGFGQPLSAFAARVSGNDSASVWDIGKDVACLELHTKMNTFNHDVFTLIETLARDLPNAFRALVIGNDHPTAFSSGADLGYFLDLVRQRDFASIRSFLQHGQSAFQALKSAPFPVVAAAHGLALGGGCEVLLHCDRIIAHAELNAGLPEPRAGLLPGWGGCARMALRQLDQGLEHALAATFQLILSARPSQSALDARASGILRPTDVIVMNRDRVLVEARTQAVALADGGYAPPPPVTLTAAPQGFRDVLLAQAPAQADPVIASALAAILCGGGAAPGTTLREQDLLDLERETILELAQRPVTAERIEALLPSTRGR